MHPRFPWFSSFGDQKRLPIAKFIRSLPKNFANKLGIFITKSRVLVRIHTIKFTQSSPNAWEDKFLGIPCLAPSHVRGFRDFRYSSNRSPLCGSLSRLRHSRDCRRSREKNRISKHIWKIEWLENRMGGKSNGGFSEGGFSNNRFVLQPDIAIASEVSVLSKNSLAITDFHAKKPQHTQLFENPLPGTPPFAIPKLWRVGTTPISEKTLRECRVKCKYFMWVRGNSGNRSESCSENCGFRVDQVTRERPFREWNFVFREWNFQFRELLREYPGTL